MNKKKLTSTPSMSGVRTLQTVNKDQFASRLRDFHCSRKTPFLQAPIVFGRRINFLKLYNLVLNLGGYRKVNDQHLWPSVLEGLGFRKYCFNAELAIRHVYQRYLEPYERTQANKDEKEQSFRAEEISDDSEMGRFKRQNQVLVDLHTSTYNLQNHIIPNHMRNAWGLSEDLTDALEFQLIEKALVSGLPNEVDFAINTCLLLSNQPGGLPLARNPRLIALLAAHAGVFEDCERSYFPLFQDWKRDKRNVLRFWFESIWDEEFRNLLNPHCVNPTCSEDFSVASVSQSWRLFALTPDLTLRDAEGQRVLLVATILRNLVIDDRCNAAVVSRSPSAMRFLLLCAACRHSALRGLALDALVAVPVMLNSMNMHKHIIARVKHCVVSTDRLEMVRGLELLAQLASFPENSDWLSEALTAEIVCQLTGGLLLRDLQLLLASLEAVYRLSGIPGCVTLLAQNSDLIHCLLALLSFEASQIGGQGIIGIKIFQGTSGQNAPEPPQPVPVQAPPAKVALLPRSVMPPPPPPQEVCRKARSPPPPSPSAPAEKRAYAEWWLRAFYEPHPQASVSRVLIYTEYGRAFHRQFGATAAPLGAQDFHNLVKDVFPGMEQIKVQMAEGKVEIHYNKVKHVQDAAPTPPSLPLPPPAVRVNHESKLPIPARPPSPPLTPPSPAESLSRKRRHSSSSSNESHRTVLTAEDPKPHKEPQKPQVGHEAVIERVLNRCVHRMEQKQPTNGHLVNGCLSPASESSQEAPKINGHVPELTVQTTTPSIIIQFCPTTSQTTNGDLEAAKLETPRPSPPLGLICEWEDCWRCYDSPSKVFHHVYSEHLPDTAAPCLWKGCDPSGTGMRAPLSLLAHLQERHCTSVALQASLDRRRTAAITGKAPEEPLGPGLVPLPCNAARQAILRLAAPEKVPVAREGPVTKHLRLTAALALRNLTPFAKGLLKAQIAILAESSLLGGEAAATISQCISQL